MIDILEITRAEAIRRGCLKAWEEYQSALGVVAANLAKYVDDAVLAEFVYGSPEGKK